MDVQVLCCPIGELTFYGCFEVSALDEFPARHHPSGVPRMANVRLRSCCGTCPTASNVSSPRRI